MVHVLTLLANFDNPVSSTCIAGSVHTNPVVIRQIVGQLREAGLVETVPGCAGGVMLKKDASQIMLDDIYQLVKTDTLFGLHPNEPNPHCPVGRNIQGVLVELFGQMDSLITDCLAKVSIQDIKERIADRESTQQEGCTR